MDNRIIFFSIVLIIIFYLNYIKNRVEEFCFLGIGDCGQTNKIETSDITNAITSVMMSNNSNCASGTNNSQLLNISCPNINLNNCSLSQIQNISTNFKCVNNSTIDSTMGDKINQAITNSLNAKQSSLTTAPQVNDQITKVVNNLTSKESISNISSCLATVKNDQATNLICSGAFICNNSMVNQDITTNLISNCLLGNSATSTAINDLVSTAQSSANVTSTGAIEDIGNAVSKILSAYMLPVLGGVIACIIFLIISSIASGFYSTSEGGQKLAAGLESTALQGGQMALQAKGMST